jgi:putative DNA primase/helicase
MTVSAARIVAALAANKRGQRLADGSYLVPCPVPSHGKGRGDRNPSLRITDGKARLLVKCFAGCDPRDVLDALRRRGLLEGNFSIETRARPARVSTRANKNNIPLALAIWNEAKGPNGTPVEPHLTNRRVMLPPRCEAVRYHPHCVFGKDDNGRWIHTPAMVALVTSIIDNKPVAIHRTALDLNGNQIERGGCKRMTLGPIEGGAIKLTPDEDVTLAIGVGEGIETTLSLQRLPEWNCSPVWCLLSKNGIADFPVLPGIETLAVAVDHDVAGERAAREVTKRWREAGREVLLLEATRDGDDLNDVVKE